MAAPAFSILIADDDSFIRDDLIDLLRDTGHRLRATSSAEETWESLVQDPPDLVLLDLKFPDLQDLSLLKRIRAHLPECEIIVVSSQTENVSQIVNAIKLGAFDFVPKPFTGEELRNRVEKALSLKRLRHANRQLLAEAAERGGVDRMIGHSEAMQTVRNTLRRLADVDGCVLLRGESGTGKELAARALHNLSQRRASPFVPINCASIPQQLVESVLFGHRRGAFTGASESVKGRFEAAEDGTLFLDEIGDMPLDQQASLLRVLEYRTFTPVGENRERDCRARFVFATNRDLRECVVEGTFREDLFYRINVAAVALPPLRARPEDIPELVEYYCGRLTLEMGRGPVQVQPDIIDLFKLYDWPGNVREVRNVLEGSLMLLDRNQTELTMRDLPADMLAFETGPDGAAVLTSRELKEKKELLRALKETSGNQTKAARMLGVHRNTIRSRVRYFGITSADVPQ
jgi:DNA-binding NtrC family response regulator